MKYFIVFILLCYSTSVLNAQDRTRSTTLVNLSGSTVTLAPPSTLTTYTVTFPGSVSLTGSMFYGANDSGRLNWLTAGPKFSILQMVGGLPTWQDSRTALEGNFVRYDIDVPQSLASTAASHFLFNVEYGTTNTGAASGARINSITTLANSNSSGLTLNATATGSGTSRGLTVTTSGGATNYAATFIGGNVGVGTSSPTSTLEVANTASNSLGSNNTSTSSQVFTIPNAVNDFSNHAFLATLNGTVSASSSGGTLTGLRGNAYLDGASGGTVSQSRGVIGVSFLSTGARVSSVATGVEGSVAYSGTANIPIMSCLMANSGPGTPLTGTGTITNWNGLYITNPIGTTPISTLNGILIDPLTYAAAATTNAIFYNSSTAPFIVKASGNVGIGVSNPSPRLHVQADTVKATASTFGGTWYPYMSVRSLQYINPSSAPATAYFTAGVSNETRIIGSTDLSNAEILGTFALNRNESSNLVHSMRTIQANLNQAGSNLVDTAVSLFSDCIVSGSGSISRLSNVRSLIRTLTTGGTGTITTAVNLDLQGVIAAPGNITNLYGLYFETPSRQVGETGVFTNVTALNIKDIPNASYITGTRRVFFYDGTGTNDAFVISAEGKVGIGDNSTSPATSLDIDGGMVVRPSTTVNVAAAGNIAVGNRSYIRLNPTASVNIGLAAGTTTGQVLIVEVLDNGANQLTFVDAGAQNLSLQGAAVNFTPSNSATLTLIWNGTIWMETARCINN